MSTTELTLQQVFDLARACLLAVGADENNASAVANIVMLAEGDGSVSHGLFRIPGYVASLKSGKVNGKADPQPETVSSVFIRCHGQNGYAPLAHARCIGPLAKAAKEYGVAVLSLTHSHHFAALWPEVEALADQGLVGLTCVSYMPAVAPSGGAEPLFGTNPLAFAWPRPGRTPMVVDMATAAMARGEVAIAARDGHEVPPGTGLDAEGRSTTDPSKILEGVLLPFGGYKGSGLAMMVELLAGPLVGENFSFETARDDNKDGGPPQGGQFVLALSPDMMSGKDWAAQSEGFFDQLAAMDGVRIPGERRHHNRANTGTRVINADLVARLREIADS